MCQIYHLLNYLERDFPIWLFCLQTVFQKMYSYHTEQQQLPSCPLPSRASVWQPASLCWRRLCVRREPSGVPEEPASVPADETDHPAEPSPPTSPAAAAGQRQPTAAAGTTPACSSRNSGFLPGISLSAFLLVRYLKKL